MAARLASHNISMLNNVATCATSASIVPYLPSTFQRRKGMVKLMRITTCTRNNSDFKVFAEVNKDPKTSSKEVVMVDPIEAKRLAAEQMQKLLARAKFKRQRVIEAVNGGWAMLGLTAGIVIEGYTGKTILSQVAGYLSMIADMLDNYLPFSSS